ncbi:DUF5610 domain-containing protein [Teredinibacter haidensis]|uniref:DUF5610 domain-containing protein n=1 Tax=Teredinibacter haidensis TaxID=2731755 RepID=UPI000948A39D|nr:DUF5610 domain-containing protein [Teredinibacter haidensis]
MIHLPTQYTGTPPSQSGHTTTQISSTTDQSTTVEAQSEGRTTTISARLSTSYSYTETRYTPATPPGPPVTYGAPVTTSDLRSPTLGGSDVQATSNVAEPTSSDKSPGAATILAFIEQRIATDVSDGLPQEELQSRLQAGFEGFRQGYNEAIQQLQDMGLYEGDVKRAVEQTFNQVAAGFAEMADKYGLENPAADVALYELENIEAPATASASDAAPTVPSTPLEAFQPLVDELTGNQEAETLSALIQPTQDFYTRMDEEKSESRQYSLRLRTNDGDLVTINSYADQGQREQSVGTASGTSSQKDSAGMEDFRISVDGDLDAAELSAINDLLGQLSDIADTFFTGDVYEAYEKALEIGYDSDEIARFSLDLTQVEYSRIESTYGAVANAESDQLRVGSSNRHYSPEGIDNRVARMSDFIQQLESVREASNRVGFQPDQLPEISEFAGRGRFGDHPHFPQFKPFMGQMFGALGRLHA